MDSNKILNANILDIIFDGKNKAYGAYDLRNTYNKRLRTALIITGSVFALLFLISLLANAMHTNEPTTFIVKDISLSRVKDEKPLPPPPPKRLLPPPPVETIHFTPPVIVKDNQVRPEETPPDIDKVQNTKIDVATNDGIKDPGIVAPPTPVTGSQVISVPENPDVVFTKVEQEAAFPGGNPGWKRYLEKNLNGGAASDNNAPEGTYTVIVKFIVSKDGSLSDIEAETSFGYGMEEEAIRIIKKSPQWTPGMQNGRNVNSYRRQPITFLIQSP